MKKKKPAKKAKVIKKKKVVKKVAAPKKKKVVKKAKPAKKTKPKKAAVAKLKTKKKAVASKKVKTAKKIAPPKKVKAAKKAPVKKAAPPKKTVSLPETPAVQDLQKQNSVFTVCSCQYTEPEAVQQAAAELNVDPHCIIKTLVMEDELGKPLLVLVPGDQDVSTEELAATIGAQEISFCSPELMEVHTGYETGAISPFGIQKVMPVFMEKSIAMLPEIYLGAGQRGLLVKMSSAELIDKLKPFMVSIAK